MQIHKEGRKILALLLLGLFAINLVLFYTIPGQTLLLNLILALSIILFLLVLQFFRNPAIVTEKNTNHVLAPADGKVVVIENTVEHEYFKQERKQISIFMSPVNVHVNRNPVSGIIKYFKYHTGKYLVAWHPKSSTDNERTTMVIELQTGLEILVRQIAGAMAKRIKYYVKEGDEIEQGAEFGFIKFGSRVDVFIPVNAEILVKVGDKTKAGRTVLAEFK
ncbi:MAG: phosphatidylserine decarboxylase family protein [Candidatus Cyclobacteriaceae bacterium M3_2C_046]